MCGLQGVGVFLADVDGVWLLGYWVGCEGAKRQRLWAGYGVFGWAVWVVLGVVAWWCLWGCGGVVWVVLGVWLWGDCGAVVVLRGS